MAVRAFLVTTERIGALISRRAARGAVTVLIGSALLASRPLAGTSLAAIDLTGNWDVMFATPVSSGTFQWQINQSGMSLTIGAPPFYTGSIDPGTGALSFGGLVCSGSPTGPDSFTGTAAPDGNSFTASGTAYVHETPTSCFPLSVNLYGTRNPCGNGTVDAGEACDDGDLLGNDCCSFTCTVQPDGVACDDGNPGTSASVCIAGTCTGLATPDLRINTTTTGPQQNASIACDGTGGFVVVWDGNDTSTNGIFGQRYDSAGTPAGTEFQIASGTASLHPDVATSTAGHFVVVWAAPNQIRARRFDSNGAALGTEFQVNTFTTEPATSPRVDSDEAGNFVVVWEGDGAGGVQGIIGRRHNAAGAPLGTEFQVNAYTTGGFGPALSVDDHGDFVVAWVSFHSPDPMSSNVFAQRYNSAGARLGSEFQVSSDIPPDFHNSFVPALAHLGGQLVFAWGDVAPGISGSPQKILARRYSTGGSAAGTEFRVDSGNATLLRPAVAGDRYGRFVVSWTGVGDGSDTSVNGQRFESDATPIGTEFQVNVFTLDNQSGPDVCAAPAGDFVVTWQSELQDGSSTGVFGRRYDVPPPPFVLDHYKCYQGKDLQNPQFSMRTAATADQLTNETVDVQQVKFVCTPVDANGAGINDPSAYLVCYQIKGASLSPRPTVEVSSQFQVTQFDLKKPKLLCVPAAMTVIP